MPLVADWVMTQFLSVGMVTSGDPFVKPLKTNPGPYDHQTFRISLKELLCLLGVGCHLFQSKCSPSLTVLLFNMGRTEKLNLPLAAFGQGPRMAPGIVFDFFIFPYGAVTSGGSQIACIYRMCVSWVIILQENSFQFLQEVPILKDYFIKSKECLALILSLGIALPLVYFPHLMYVLKLSTNSVFCIRKCMFSV